MRWDDLNDGSIKALLILVLIAANIAAITARTPGSAGAPPAVARASRYTSLRAKNFLAGRQKQRAGRPRSPDSPRANQK